MEAESSATGSARQLRGRKKRKAEPDMEPDTASARDSPVGNTTKPVKRSRKAGKLASLMSMPLDILFEIFGHLLPYDLLKLARITKDFRKVLMHKSSLSVWKTARENVLDFPDCPPEMSEPNWANLAFYPHCHYCSVPGVRNVEWRFRVRVCSKCARDHLVSSHDCDAIDELFGSGYDSEDEDGVSKEPNFGLLVPSRTGRRYSKVYLREQVVAVRAQYYKLTTDEERAAFVVERKSAVADLIQHAESCEIWARNQTHDRTEELQQLRDERKEAIIKKLEDLGWGPDIQSITWPDSLSEQKFVNKPQRLTERIWLNIKPAAIKFMESVRAHRLEREHALLVMSRKVFANEVLRTCKNGRLPCIEFLPESPDFCAFGPVKDILSQPTEVVVNTSSFDDILPLIPDMLTTWREQHVHGRIITAMKYREQFQTRGWQSSSDSDDSSGGNDEDYLNGDNDRVAKMKLAATVFQCGSCGRNDPWSFLQDSDDDDDAFYERLLNSAVQPLFYPQVLGHRCFSRNAYALVRPLDPSTNLENCPGKRKVWSADRLQINPHISRIASQIVSMTGLDPQVATADDMDELPIRFKCTECVKFKPIGGGSNGVDSDDDDLVLGRPIYNWRSAVKHQASRHPGTPFYFTDPNEVAVNDNLVLLSQNELVGVFAGESAILTTKAEIWNCALCRDLTTEVPTATLPEIIAHIEAVHNNANPVLNEDYFKDFAARDLINTPECNIWIPTL